MDNEIEIQGKKIDISALTDKQIIKLFTELKERDLKLEEKILVLENKIEALKERM